MSNINNSTKTPVNPNTDRATDVLRFEPHSLEEMLSPKTVALIGATDKPNSVGRTLLTNLLSPAFKGQLFPINPHYESLLEHKVYPHIKDAPAPVELAVIATPAATVPAVMAECVDAGVKGAIIISAGFKEIGAKGVELEQQILAQARRGGVRIIGPNCLGVMRPAQGLNATFAAQMAMPGRVGFVSQSGALCTAVLDWSFRERVGFSAFISLGSMLDVGWGDLIDFLGNDPKTQSIVIYMETIGDARQFMSAAREVAFSKPIIVLKAGRTQAAARAAASHTGSLAGSDEVLDAVFRRCGVLRVNSIAEMFYLAETLAKQARPKGPRLTIVTNAGGPGVLATDALITDGGMLAELSAQTLAALNEFLPPHWSHNNPVDMVGDADPERYEKTLKVVAQEPNSDGLLVILTPQAMTAPTQTAELLKPYGKSDKPILACWMGGNEVEAGEAALNAANIPTFGYPDTAVQVFNHMWRFAYNLRGLYETPTLRAFNEQTQAHAQAKPWIAQARRAGRTLLSEFESKQLLAAYGLPIVQTQIATSAVEAVRLAKAIGYPVVLKLHSETISHKTDVGGVQLDLRDAKAVKRAYEAIQQAVSAKAGAEHFLGVVVEPMIAREGYELILGSSVDAQCGPVLLFGVGGQLVEVFDDHALALPPLTSTLARRMMEQTHIYAALKGVRGRPPVDLSALEQLLVAFSQLVIEQRAIKEIDINPLLASHKGLLALDARVILHPADVDIAQLPRPAIRPYPTQYIAPWRLRDGSAVTIRPIRPEDEPLIVKFHENLSEQTVYFRYFHMMRLSDRIAHERLTRICFIDYDREMALVVERQDPASGAHEILAVGRLTKLHGRNEAEFAILVSDLWQGHGLGTELLRRLVQVGRDEKLHRIVADILAENGAMQKVSRKIGFTLKRVMGEGTMHATLEL